MTTTSYNRAAACPRTLLIVAAVFLVGGGIAAAGPSNTTVSGYVMGLLSTVLTDDRARGIRSGELLLGIGSTGRVDDASIFQGAGNPIENPWLFCFDPDDVFGIDTVIGERVVAEFRQPKRASLISCSAANQLLDVYPVSTGIEPVFSVESRKLTRTTRTGGIIVGRIVTAVEVGKIRKERLLTIQQSTGGDAFEVLNVADEDVYDFAIGCLKRADRVRIHFVDRSFKRVRWGATGRFVDKIERLE